MRHIWTFLHLKHTGVRLETLDCVPHVGLELNSLHTISKTYIFFYDILAIIYKDGFYGYNG